MALSAKSTSGALPAKTGGARALGKLALRGPRHARWLVQQQFGRWRERSYLAASLDRVRPLSMVAERSLLQLGRYARWALAEDIPGDFVECGVWRGGSAFLIADLLRRQGVQDRKVWLFDSFEGHQPPEEIDGDPARAYIAKTDSPEYFDNCRVPVEDVQRSARGLGLAPFTEIVKGWFDESLPATRERIGPIALLRVDCDWYASVRTCLEQLYDQVSTGGFVIFDDYYDWDGCTVAVHEFLAERRLPHRIASDDGVAYIRKP
ncbi:MAG: TylF/MycF/NovP-related O-methyltransferase [Dehalococcoidia bacterium]